MMECKQKVLFDIWSLSYPHQKLQQHHHKKKHKPVDHHMNKLHLIWVLEVCLLDTTATWIGKTALKDIPWWLQLKFDNQENKLNDLITKFTKLTYFDFFLNGKFYILWDLNPQPHTPLTRRFSWQEEVPLIYTTVFILKCIRYMEYHSRAHWQNICYQCLSSVQNSVRLSIYWCPLQL